MGSTSTSGGFAPGTVQHGISVGNPNPQYNPYLMSSGGAFVPGTLQHGLTVSNSNPQYNPYIGMGGAVRPSPADVKFIPAQHMPQNYTGFNLKNLPLWMKSISIGNQSPISVNPLIPRPLPAVSVDPATQHWGILASMLQGYKGGHPILDRILQNWGGRQRGG